MGGNKMLKFPMLALVAALLLAGCMTGPIPLSSNNNAVNPSAPSEEKLPGTPETRAATP